MSGSLATEKHGDRKTAFIDLKFKFLLTEAEINEWINPEAAGGPMAPYGFIFDDKGKLWLAGCDITAQLRDNIRGDLQLQADGIDLMIFEDAHIVGKVSKLSFKIGGHGVVILQLRVDHGDELDNIISLIEAGDCMLQFEEYDPDDTPSKKENQEELAV